MPFASSFWKNIAPYLVLQVVGVILFIIGFALFTPGMIPNRPEWDEIHLWCGVLEVSGFVFLLVGTTGAGIAACRCCLWHNPHTKSDTDADKPFSEEAKEILLRTRDDRSVYVEQYQDRLYLIPFDMDGIHVGAVWRFRQIPCSASYEEKGTILLETLNDSARNVVAFKTQFTVETEEWSHKSKEGWRQLLKAAGCKSISEFHTHSLSLSVHIDKEEKIGSFVRRGIVMAATKECTGNSPCRKGLRQSNWAK